MTADNADPLNPTDEMWRAVEVARESHARFLGLLKKMSREELFRFYWGYRGAAGELRDAPYTDYMDQALSEDGIEEIAHWVVAQGKEAYDGVIANPEQLPQRAPEPINLSADARAEYEDRFGEPMPSPRRRGRS